MPGRGPRPRRDHSFLMQPTAQNLPEPSKVLLIICIFQERKLAQRGEATFPGSHSQRSRAGVQTQVHGSPGTQSALGIPGGLRGGRGRRVAKKGAEGEPEEAVVVGTCRVCAARGSGCWCLHLSTCPVLSPLQLFTPLIFAALRGWGCF